MTLIVVVNEKNYHLYPMDDPQARALLAGTLALMTQFAESGCPFSADRIRQNLLRLSAMQGLPWEFRAALAKLGARWSRLEPKSTLH